MELDRITAAEKNKEKNIYEIDTNLSHRREETGSYALEAGKNGGNQFHRIFSFTSLG